MGIAHSLSVFNFFFGILCLSIPGLLITLIIYFTFEDKTVSYTIVFLLLTVLGVYLAHIYSYFNSLKYV